ncbi:hypothetical protein Kisp01_42590 [Kineosporia sp. NBRC 101677]|uniref:hypothetical protein n=1 Tax=Kineosporia sp. NBRC 101677 TaxID=3032197 RepID=UPI0024A0BCDA|nr:hypothetical protein [Kineosporia sp. NBRC 101677]GLY17244.1 hypothetical protein Kisp01_42590 [Kineosporia sp. NBRC 101677]
MSRDDLEDRLEALLHDRGLDLPPRPGATDIVEGQVRRARRRRRAVQTALPAALTVVAVAAGFALAGKDSDEAPTQPAYDILSGQGLGDLRIGMDIADAQEAGLVRDVIEEGKGNSGSCNRYEGVGSVDYVVTEGGVVVQIEVGALAETPEAINIGDTYGDIVRAYPRVGPLDDRQAPAEIRFEAPGGDGNLYRLVLETSGMNVDASERQPSSSTKITDLALLAGSQVGEDYCWFSS